MTQRLVCPEHPFGHATCHYPHGAYERTEREPYQAPGLLAQVLGLKWEIGFWLLVLGSIVGYITLTKGV